MAPELPEAPPPTKRYANPGRRAVRDAAQARSRWVHYHDHAMRQLCRIALTKLPAEDPAAPSEALEKRRAALQNGCHFKPYRRNRATHPRVVEQRDGSWHRLVGLRT
jgi:hypothetical protein